MEQQRVQRGLSTSLAASSSFRPFDPGQFAQKDVEFAKSAPLNPGDPVGELPFEGASQSLSEYQANNKDAPLVFDAPNKFAGWSSPSEQAIIQKSKTGGYYVEDPANPDTIAHQPRSEYNAGENAAILNGLSPRLFQIDHNTPLFAGGLDVAGQKQILPVDTHAKKTKVQAVPLTLWRTFNNNPELAQQYGMKPMTLAEMRAAIDNWENYSDTGVPAPDTYGQVPLDTAVKIWKAWQEPKKMGIVDQVKLVPGKVAKNAAELFVSVPILGPAAMGGIQGFSNGVTLGYAKKYAAPDFFAPTDWEAARAERDKTLTGNGTWTGEGKYALSNYPVLEKISHALDWLEGVGLKTSEYNAAAQNIGNLVGETSAQGMLFAKAGTVLGGLNQSAAAGKFGNVLMSVGKATGKASNVIDSVVTKTLNLPAKAWQRFGPGKTAVQAAANTTNAAKEAVAAAEGIAPALQTASKFWTDAGIAKVPMVIDEYGNALKAIKTANVVRNIGLMNVMALAQQQDDRSMKATAERALFATINGRVGANDTHTIPGYLKVFGKGLTLGLMESGWYYDKNGQQDMFGGALQNALLMTALHGAGHKAQRGQEMQTEVLSRYSEAAKAKKPGEKISFQPTKAEIKSGVMKQPMVQDWMKNIRSSANAQEMLQARVQELTDYRSAKILSSVLPDQFKDPGSLDGFKYDTYSKGQTFSTQEIARLAKEGNAAIEKMWESSYKKDANGNFVTENGRYVSSGTDADVQLSKQKFAAALRNLEYRGKPEAEQAIMDLQDLKTYGEMLRNKLLQGEYMADMQTRLGAQVSKDYLFSSPDSTAVRQTAAVPVDPSAPTGVTQTTGIGAVMQGTDNAQWARVLAAQAPGSKETLGNRVLIERVPGSVEATRRSFYTPEEMARHDVDSDPRYVLKVSIPIKQADGSMTLVPVGYLPSEWRLNRADYALNKRAGIVDGVSQDGKFEVYNLDKDSLGKWMQTNGLGAMYADISVNGGISNSAQKPYVKLNVTLDNLETSKQVFAGTDDILNANKSLFQILEQAKTAKTPGDRQRTVDEIRARLPVEPFHELVDQAFPPDFFGKETAAIKDVSKIVADALITSDPEVLAKTVNDRFGNVVTEELARDWASRPGEVTPSEVFDAMHQAFTNKTLNEDGQAAYRAALNFFKTPEFVTSLTAGTFLDMPVVGSKPDGSIPMPRAEAVTETVAPVAETVQAKPTQVAPDTAPVQTVETPAQTTETTVRTIETPAQKAALAKEMPEAQPKPESEAPVTGQKAPPDFLDWSKPTPETAKKEVGVAKTVVAATAPESTIDTTVMPDAVDLPAIEKPVAKAYGRWKGNEYAQTSELFTKAQEGKAPNSPEFKALEKAKQRVNREELKTRFRQLIEKHGGNTQKAIEEQTASLENYVQQVAKQVGVEMGPLFPDAESKQDFKRLLVKIKNDKPRKTIEISSGKVVTDDGAKTTKFEPTAPIDDMIDAYSKAHPEDGPLEVFRLSVDKDTVLKAKTLSDLEAIVNKGKANSDKIVFTGIAGNDPNTLIGIKYNEALAKRYTPPAGQEKMPMRDRFLRSLEENVYKLSEKDRNNLGSFNKRNSLVHFHEPQVDWRDADGKPVELDFITIKPKTMKELGLFDESRLDLTDAQGRERAKAAKIKQGIADAEQGDGNWEMTAEGLREYQRAQGIPESLGYAKIAYTMPVKGADGVERLVSIKGQIHAMQPTRQRRLEREFGGKLPNTTIIMPEGNVKLGVEAFGKAEDGKMGLRVPSSGLRGKIHGEHNSMDAKFSLSGLSHLSADDGLNAEVAAIYKPVAEKYVKMIDELNANRGNITKQREILESYKDDFGVTLDGDTDYEAMRDVLARGDRFSTERFLQKAVATVPAAEILSGKSVVRGTHNYVAPDMELKGGKQLDRINPEDTAEWGNITKIAEVIQNSKGKSGMKSADKIAKNWQEMFGEDSITSQEAKILAKGGAEADVNLVFDILESAKKRGVLNSEGESFLETERKRASVQHDEIMLSRKDWLAMGKPEYVFTTRQPITSRTSPATQRVLIAEDFGANLGDGVSVASMYDGVVNKQFDNDGDAYSIFPVGDKPGMLSPKIAEAYEKTRRESGDITLDPLEKYGKIETNLDGVMKVVNGALAGGDAVASTRALARQMRAIADSGLPFTVGKGDKQKTYKLNLDKDGLLLLAQVPQEATDSVKYKSLDERLTGPNGEKWGADSYILDKLFKVNGGPKDSTPRNLSNAIREEGFSVPFQLADENRAMNNTKNFVDEVQKVVALNAKIRANGGKVHPIYQALEESFGGMKPLDRLPVEQHQASDYAAANEVRKVMAEKYGDKELMIVPGTPEAKIRNLVLDIQRERQNRKQNGMVQAKEAFAREVIKAVENGTLGSDAFENMPKGFVEAAQEFVRDIKSGNKNRWLPGTERDKNNPNASIFKDAFLNKYFDEKAFNMQTEELRKQATQKVLDTFREMQMSKQGLSPEQLRRITYFLVTDPKANSNFFPTGRGEDVRRLNQLFLDKEVSDLYYQARDAWQPPEVNGPITIDLPPEEAPRTQLSPSQFKTLGK